MIKLIIILTVTVFLLFSCSPVSNKARIGSVTNSKELVDKNEEKLNIASIEDSILNTEKIINDSQKQVGDTLMIQLPDVMESSNSFTDKKDSNPAGSKVDDGDNESIQNELELAVDLYEQNKIDKAQEKLVAILSTLSKENRQYYQARYYLSECDISKNKLKVAKKNLEELFKTETLEDDILEKVILRLGQIECFNKNNDKANEYFEELKDRFPSSELLKLANCDFVKK